MTAFHMQFQNHSKSNPQSLFWCLGIVCLSFKLILHCQQNRAGPGFFCRAWEETAVAFWFQECAHISSFTSPCVTWEGLQLGFKAYSIAPLDSVQHVLGTYNLLARATGLRDAY